MNNQYWQISVIKNVIEELKKKKGKFLYFVLSIRADYESGFVAQKCFIKHYSVRTLLDMLQDRVHVVLLFHVCYVLCGI
jgi:hypothetical protein